MILTRLLPRALVIALLAFAPALSASSATTDPVYRTPDPTLVDIVTTPYAPLVRVSPDQQWLLLFDRPSLPGIAELSEPELRLAGYRIQPRRFGPSRNRPSSGYRFVRVSDGAIHPVTGLPEDARVQFTSFSPDGKRIAFTRIAEDGWELWTAEVETG
ncbi:MAG TPA: S9 family peptidase, partial [bacterium]|nr:S9 family peptidase [bacterium]